MTPFPTPEARAAEEWWIRTVGGILRARCWGQGIGRVEFLGSSVTGWQASVTLGSGKQVTVPMSLDLALGLQAPGADREDWADAAAEFIFERISQQLEPPPPEPSENDKVNAGFVGDDGLGQIQLHPDFAHKIGDIAHEVHQHITGRKL
jgi:hypothetical protein